MQIAGSARRTSHWSHGVLCARSSAVAEQGMRVGSSPLTSSPLWKTQRYGWSERFALDRLLVELGRAARDKSQPTAPRSIQVVQRPLGTIVFEPFQEDRDATTPGALGHSGRCHWRLG